MAFKDEAVSIKTLPSYLLSSELLLPGAEGDIAPAECVQMRNAEVTGNGLWDGFQGYQRFVRLMKTLDEAKLRQFFPKVPMVTEEGEAAAATMYHPLRAVDDINAAELTPKLQR